MVDLATSIAFGVIFIPLTLLALGSTFRDAAWPFMISAAVAGVAMFTTLNSPHAKSAAMLAGRGEVEMAALSSGLIFVVVALSLCVVTIFWRKVARIAERVSGRGKA